MNKQILLLSSLAGALATGGCAHQLRGAVVPMQGGAQQSVVRATNKTDALKNFDADAKLTCGKSNGLAVLSTDGRYSVVSQTSNEKPAEKIKSDSKNLDAGISVGMKYLGMESKDSYELTTVFKCE